MPRKYPPLTEREVVAILRALGFKYSHSEGGHDFYKGCHSERNWKVTVDPKCSPFDEFLLKSMALKQAGVSREQFYAATSGTAAKIAVQPSKQPLIAFWPSFQATFSDCGHRRLLPVQHNANNNHRECFECHPELRTRPIPGRCPSCDKP